MNFALKDFEMVMQIVPVSLNTCLIATFGCSEQRKCKSFELLPVYAFALCKDGRIRPVVLYEGDTEITICPEEDMHRIYSDYRACMRDIGREFSTEEQRRSFDARVQDVRVYDYVKNSGCRMKIVEEENKTPDGLTWWKLVPSDDYEELT